MVGTAEADRLALSGAMLPPQEALRVGLVDAVVPHDELMVSDPEPAGALPARLQ